MRVALAMIVQSTQKQPSQCLSSDGCCYCSKLGSFSLFGVLSKPTMEMLVKKVCHSKSDHCNIRNQIISIFVLLQSTISHLGSRNVLFGIFKVFKLLPVSLRL
jgi:hypothetical protein